MWSLGEARKWVEKTATDRKKTKFSRYFQELLVPVHQFGMVKKNPIYSVLHRVPEGIKRMHFKQGKAERPDLNGSGWDGTR